MLKGTIVIGLSLLVATGCFSDDGDDGPGPGANPPASGGSDNGEGDGLGGAGSDTAGDGGATGGKGTGGSTSSGGSGNDETEDPYCAHAWNGFEQLDIFLDETNAIESDMDGPTVNAHGDAALEAAELTGEHFGKAKDFVVETDTSEAFDAMLLYQELYMVPLAKIAAMANDGQSYTMASFQLLQQDGVAAAAANGAIASGTISAYTVQRCGRASWPE